MICHHKMQWFYLPLFFREYKIGKMKKTLKFPAKLSFCCALFPRLVIWGGFGRTVFCLVGSCPSPPSTFIGAGFDNKKNTQGNLGSQAEELTVLEVFIPVSH